MPDTEFMCPVKHLFCFVSSCPVSPWSVNTKHFCVAPVPILDDSDMVRYMPVLHLQVPLIQGLNNRAQDHSGVTSTTIPPLG